MNWLDQNIWLTENWGTHFFINFKRQEEESKIQHMVKLKQVSKICRVPSSAYEIQNWFSQPPIKFLFHQLSPEESKSSILGRSQNILEGVATIFQFSNNFRNFKRRQNSSNFLLNWDRSTKYRTRERLRSLATFHILGIHLQLNSMASWEYFKHVR